MDRRSDVTAYPKPSATGVSEDVGLERDSLAIGQENRTVVRRTTGRSTWNKDLTSTVHHSDLPNICWKMSMRNEQMKWMEPWNWSNPNA